MGAVRDDTQIPDANRLTLEALQDHLPEMLGELITGLREPATLLDAESRDAANEHGKARWRQGYRLDEVLRELARIREIVLARVRPFWTEHQFLALRDDAEEGVRRFFDLMVAHSARQFMREQQAPFLVTDVARIAKNKKVSRRRAHLLVVGCGEFHRRSRDARGMGARR